MQERNNETCFVGVKKLTFASCGEKKKVAVKAERLIKCRRLLLWLVI